jgi:fibronectin-binding autotransporter adhesin
MTVVSENRWLALPARKTSRRDPGRNDCASRRSYRLSLDALEDRTTPSALFLVTNSLDPVGKLVPGSLRWAVARANHSGGQAATVEITPAVQGSITLHAGELRLSSSMTIENASGGPLAIRQATPSSRIFHVVNNPRATAVTITGQGDTDTLTLTGGRVRNGNGGAILVDNPRNVLTLTDVNVVGNSAAQVGNPRLGAAGNGGGIYSSGSVTLDHSRVSANSASGPNGASGHAGGVYTDQGITLVASHVDSNSARNAGGILNVYGSVEVLNGSTVNGNTSSGSSFSTGDLGGGGIGQMAGNVVVSASQVSDNKTVGMYSGGIVLLTGGVTVTDGSQVDGNTCNGPGGGIAANFGGSVVVSDGSEVVGNTGAGVGGGIVNWSETFGIVVTDHSRVAGNTLTNAEDAAVTSGLIQVYQNPSVRGGFLAGGRGDAMLASALQLFVNTIGQRASLIEQAAAALPSEGLVQVGGGVSTILGGPIDVSGGSTIAGNHFAVVDASKPAGGIGGGVFANLATITVDGSTISGNVATGDGGGIWNGRSLSISNSTVTQNQAAGHGGGIFNRGTFISNNTKISNNTPDDVYP